MTPAEIQDAVRRLKEECGSKASCTVSVYHDAQPGALVTCFLRPLGYGREDPSIIKHADTFEEAIFSARAAWLEMRDRVELDNIKTLAMDIIANTYDHGECTEAMLRVSWSQADIDRYGERACAAADEMADHKPYRITPTSGGNSE